MDESTDSQDMAQQLLFIRGVDKNFDVNEELAGMQSLNGHATGQDIFNEIRKCFKLKFENDFINLVCLCGLCSHVWKNNDLFLFYNNSLEDKYSPNTASAGFCTEKL